VALAPQESRLAGWSFLLGTALFSGSLYVCTNFNPSQILPASPAVTNKNILAGARVDSSQEVGNDHPLRRYRLRCGLGRLVLSRVPRKRVSFSRFLAKETKHITILCILALLSFSCYSFGGRGKVGIQRPVDCLSARRFNFIWLPPLSSKLCQIFQQIGTKSGQSLMLDCTGFLFTTKGQSYSTLLFASRPLPKKQQTFVASAYGRSSASYLSLCSPPLLYFYLRYIPLFILFCFVETKDKVYKNPFSGLGMSHQRQL